MKYLICFIVCVSLTFTKASSQIQDNSTPYSLSLENKIDIPTFQLTTINTDSLKKDDAKNMFRKIFCFAYIVEVNINPQELGIWLENDSVIVWLLKIKSEQAFSLAFTFENIFFKPGEKLFCYNSDKTFVTGGIGQENNNSYNFLQTLYIAGEEVIIEFLIDKKISNSTTKNFRITKIAHDYRNIYKQISKSENCEVNINCPEGEQWQTEKKAIVKYTYSNKSKAYLCSGVLIANTAKNEIPYLLTAEHCVNEQNTANSTVFYFNHESKSCNSFLTSNLQTMNGATLLATGINIDFSLLQLNILPPEEYEPFYAGWTTAENSDPKLVCLHHPGGDLKKISIDEDGLATGNFGDKYMPNTHWIISEWETGATEGGSSGAPLFDNKHHVVGTLTGGDATCENPVNDYFQKFSIAWDKNAKPENQLKYWLNPDNISIISMNGYFPYLGKDLNKVHTLSAYLNTNLVFLQWQAPLLKNDDQKSEPNEYILYRNLQKIATINGNDILKYVDTLKEDGKFVYHLTAVYNQVESYPSNQVTILKNYSEVIEEKPDIKIYPNPIQDFLYVELNDTIVAKNIKIFNLIGQLKLFSIVKNQNYIFLDLQFLDKGMYIFIFEAKNLNYEQLIIKQ